MKKNILKGYLLAVFTIAFTTQIYFVKNDLSQNTSRIDLSSQSDSDIEALYLNPKNTHVKVCWARFDQLTTMEDYYLYFNDLAQQTDYDMFDQSIKASIQQKIQEQFTIENTGIEFIGWNECTDKDASQIKIFGFRKGSQAGERGTIVGSCEIANSIVVGDDVNNYKTVENKTGRARAMFLSFLDSTAGDSNSTSEPNAYINVLSTSLHEFGHAAGLHHGHLNPDIKNDPNCERFSYEQYHKKTMVNRFVEYDPISIMNMCFLNRLQRQDYPKAEDIKLSPGDIKTLKCTYALDKMQSGQCKKKLIDLSKQKIENTKKTK